MISPVDMDFGKLPSVDHVLFELPPEDPRTVASFGKTGRAPVPQVYVGGPIWTCPKWIGRIYPKGTSARDNLRAYGRQFNSIELNSSFYRIPDPAQVQAWKSAVPADFKFAPKLHQDISHFDQFAKARAALQLFWKSIEHFEENLGICFLQLPPLFGFSSWGILKQLLREIPDPKRLAVEFRHPSWFVQRTIRPEVFDFLQALGISLVITDVAGRRDVLHSSLTTKKVLIRFTGNELHPSDYTRIDSWVERVASWIDRGIEEVYFFIHQPTEAEVPELSKNFIEALNRRCGLSVRSWAPVEELERSANPQMSFF
jgi:uncharacterized protein YecE (DUF72 family)